MSSEYTIDIQLTELGFPDVLKTVQTPVKIATSPVTLPYGPIYPISTPPPPITTSQDIQLANIDPCNVAPLIALSVTHSGLHVPQTACASEDDIKHLVREAGESREILSVDGEKSGLGEKRGLETLSEESDDSEVSEMDEDLDDDDDDENEKNGLDKGDEAVGCSSDYRCGVCDLHLPSTFKLQEHMNLHMGVRPYCCAECGKFFCHLFNYRSHLRTHAKSKLNLLCCRICQERFETDKGLKDHLSSTHFEKEFYECGLCKLVFTCKKKCEHHLEWHKLVMGKHVCKTCGRHFINTKSLVRHHLRNRCMRSHSCTVCSKSFIGKNALLKHSFSHLGLLPYTCAQCRRHFRLANLYRKHKCEPERIHCVACLGVFLSQEDFQRHKKDTGCWGYQGSKGDEICCMECGQSFTSVEELKKHAGAHQRVMSCSECGKGFRSSLMLMSHMGGHAAQRPCLCQSCGFGFPHQQAYDCHLKTCSTTPPQMTASKKHPNIPQIPEKATAQTPSKLEKIPIPLNKHAGQLARLREKSSDKLKDSQGIWKLALDKESSPGMGLVMLVSLNSGRACSEAASTSPHSPFPLEVQPPRVIALPPAPVQGLGNLLQEQSSCASSDPRLSQLHSDVLLDKSCGLRESKQKKYNLLPLDLSKNSKMHFASKTQPTDVEIFNTLIDQEICGTDYSNWAIFKPGTTHVTHKSEVDALKEAPESTDHLNQGETFTCPVEIKIEPQPLGIDLKQETDL